jgi:parvulin-like peptidyl-prolyl isomerase
MLACVIAVAGAQAPDLGDMDIVLRAVPAGPVARVNGESIDAEEFKELYRSELAHIMSQGPNVEFTTGDRVQLGLLCLRQLIDRRILLQQAAKKGLTVSQDEIATAYAQQVESLQKAFAGSAGRTVTEEEILSGMGSTKEALLAELKNALLVEKMRTSLLKEKNVTVSDAEILAYYEKNKKQFSRPDLCHMKQIFFQAPPEDSNRKGAAEQRQQARKKAEDALKRIQAGQSFEAVARELSEGAFKEQGGDWGNVPAAQLPPFLVDAAYALQPEEVSGIIESEYGCHIIKLVSITAAAEPELAKIKPLIERQMLNEKGEDVVGEFCRTVMDQGGDLDVFLELEKSIMLESGVAGTGQAKAQ